MSLHSPKLALLINLQSTEFTARQCTWIIGWLCQTNDGRCTCEIKCRTAMAEAEFNKKRVLFTSKLYLELRKKLVKCYIWSIALYGSQTWTLRAVDQKHLESFETWCWRSMKKISWTDNVRNEEILLKSRSRGISYMK